MSGILEGRLCIATMCADWERLAEDAGLGVELDHFCQAKNMDGSTEEAKRVTESFDARILHAPFNELFPAAIDPKARQLAMDRVNQAAGIAIDLGIRKMVVHSGYVPFVYFKEWHRDRSIEFWQEFMADKPADFEICIENVLDDEPFMMVEIAEGIGDKRVGLCFDVGHANIVGSTESMKWLEVMAPYLKHLHIHNNDGTGDFHGDLNKGTVDVASIIDGVGCLCGKDTTVTLEVLEGKNSLDWLKAEGYYI